MRPSQPPMHQLVGCIRLLKNPTLQLLISVFNLFRASIESRNPQQQDTLCAHRMNGISIKPILRMIPAHHIYNTAHRCFHAPNEVSRWKLFWPYVMPFRLPTAVVLRRSTCVAFRYFRWYFNNNQPADGAMRSTSSWPFTQTKSLLAAFIAPFIIEEAPHHLDRAVHYLCW